MKKSILPVVFAFFLCTASGEDKLVVHEWGTFTSLQDEDGKPIGGINVDDEPLPNFVHRLAYYLMLPPTGPGSPVLGFAVMSKGITPKCHPDVTMRLETPVIYFYPPAGWKPQPVNVHVAFHGGWLSEFYPDAIFNAPGFDSAHPGRAYSNKPGADRAFSGIGRIKPDAVGELSWKGLVLDTGTAGPETQEKVWLAPRDVKAATVKTVDGEAEKFLFYRGVANVEPALGIVRDSKNNMLQVRRNDTAGPINMNGANEAFRIPAAWLLDVRADGTCAFKSVGTIEIMGHPELPASFNANDYSPDNMQRLKGEMRSALTGAGLYPDEADALLNTWQLSYFKSPGLRFFYVCPHYDVNEELPLDISPEPQLTRAMIGRIEIVTPEQRALLAKIAAGPAPEPTAGGEVKTDPLHDDYAELGRFRNALILDEEKHRPTPALADFIRINGLEAYDFK